MKPDTYAWTALYEHAGSLLRPGFAQRTQEVARVVAPTFASQILLSLATATVCVTAICAVHSHFTEQETARNLAGWQQIAAESEMLGQL